MPRTVVPGLAVLTAQALLIGALLRVDLLPSLPPRPVAAGAEYRSAGCTVEPLAPAAPEWSGGVPSPYSPSEHARIYLEALRLLIDQSVLLGEALAEAGEIRVASETRMWDVASPDMTPGCAVARWRELVAVSDDTLRAWLRENGQPASVPMPLLAWDRTQRLRSVPHAARSFVPCGPLVVQLSKPGVNRAIGEAFLSVTVRRNGSGGAFLVTLGAHGHAWRGAAVERLSFIDGWCAPASDHTP